MPRKRKAAGRKATNPSPAKRAKLNPKSNKKLVQTQAMDASSNNKAAQANPPSPVSSCASSAANSPSPSTRTQLLDPRHTKPRRRHGLALAAFAVTHHMMGIAPNSEQYFKVAVNMAKFMYKHMREEATGHLLPIFGIFTERDDKGFSSDYAHRICGLSFHGLLKLHQSERIPVSMVHRCYDDDPLCCEDCCEDAYSGDVELCRDIVRAWRGLKIWEIDVADQVIGSQHGSVVHFMMTHYYGWTHW